MRRLIIAAALLGLAGCGGSGGAKWPGAERTISAWRTAGVAYDAANRRCAGSPTPAGDFWANCTAQARGDYTTAARSLGRLLRQHSRSAPCAAADSKAAHGVESVTRSYRRVAVAADRWFKLAARHRFKRASRGPSLASLITQAHAARLGGRSAVAALGRCLR